MQMLKLKIHPDKVVAPRYDEKTKQLELKEVILTEMGTQDGLPILDFKMTDSEGKEYFFMTTGGMANMISAAVKGVNLKNHGVEEP